MHSKLEHQDVCIFFFCIFFFKLKSTTITPENMVLKINKACLLLCVSREIPNCLDM